MRYGLSLFNDNFFDNTFNRFFDDFDVSATLGRKTSSRFVPAVEVNETESHFVLSADLPGLSKSDIHVDTKDNRLTISGERKVESEKHEHSHRWTERSFGKFERSFTLPAGVDTQKIEAFHKDGVLKVSIPKPVEARTNRIQIQEGKAGFFDKLKGKKSEEKEVN